MSDLKEVQFANSLFLLLPFLKQAFIQYYLLTLMLSGTNGLQTDCNYYYGNNI